MANLYDKAGLVNIPVGYQDGFLYNIKPEDNTLGFRFNRDSAATRVNKEGLIEQVGYFGPELVQNGNFSELRSELITNGTFDNNIDNWAAKSSVISWSNGKLSCDNSSGNSAAGPYQANVWVDTEIYKVTVTMQLLSGDSNGNIRVLSSSSTGSSQSTLVTGNQLTIGGNAITQTFYLTPSSSDVSIQFACNSSNAVFTIDNVSVKQVDPNDYWTLGIGWSFGNNVASSDGTQAGNSSLFQGNVLTQNKFYKFEFTLSNVTSGSVRLRNGVGASETYISYKSANGTYFSYAQVNEVNTTLVVDADLNFVGSVSNISVVEVLGDKPRIDYTDSLTSPSFLLEPQSTNLLTFSENLKNYENSNTVCTSNYAISPDGTKNATRVDFTASSTNALGVNGAVNNGETITQSVFVKYIDAQFVQLWFGSSGFGGGNTNFDLINGTTSNPSGSSSSMKKMGNGWWRISSTRTATSTASNTGIFKLVVVDSLTSSRFGDEANGSVLAFGGQYEQKSYPTSYIPTAGSTVTRAQETCNGAGNLSTFNSTEGVLYAEISALANDGTNRYISLSDGSLSNRVNIFFDSNNNLRGFYNGLSGSIIINTDITLNNKIAFKYKSGDSSFWLNGFEVATKTDSLSLSGLDSLSFDSGGGSDFYGKVKGVYVFNEALTDDELQQLTGPEYNSFAALAAAYNYTVI